MEKPVLMGVSGDAAELIKRPGEGICFPPGDSLRLVAAGESMISMSPIQLAKMGEAGRQFYESELSLRASLPKYEPVFEAAISS